MCICASTTTPHDASRKKGKPTEKDQTYASRLTAVHPLFGKMKIKLEAWPWRYMSTLAKRKCILLLAAQQPRPSEHDYARWLQKETNKNERNASIIYRNSSDNTHLYRRKLNQAIIKKKLIVHRCVQRHRRVSETAKR